MIKPSANAFSADIERLRSERKMEYTEAIVAWCDDNGVDIEYAAALVKKDPTLMALMECEARSLNHLKRGPELPI